MTASLLVKYRKSDGLVVSQNYYTEVPTEDADYAFTDLLPTANFVKMHFDSVSNNYYEGATIEEIEQNTILTAVNIVSRRQLKLALILGGFDLSIIDNVINSLPTQDKIIASIAWNDAVTFERKDPLLLSLASAVGFSEIQLAELFNQASQL